MIKNVVLCAVFFLASALPVKAEGTAFMSGFEDLPLMNGLIQQDDASVSFDTPAGRIIEAYAESPKVEKKKIIAFYDRTLPQLGWKKLKKQKDTSATASYSRDGETLDISVENGEPVVVRFELTTQ